MRLVAISQHQVAGLQRRVRRQPLTELAQRAHQVDRQLEVGPSELGACRIRQLAIAVGVARILVVEHPKGSHLAAARTQFKAVDSSLQPEPHALGVAQIVERETKLILGPDFDFRMCRAISDLDFDEFFGGLFNRPASQIEKAPVRRSQPALGAHRFENLQRVRSRAGRVAENDFVDQPMQYVVDDLAALERDQLVVRLFVFAEREDAAGEELETAGRKLAKPGRAPRPRIFRIAGQHPRQARIGYDAPVAIAGTREFVRARQVAHPLIVGVGIFFARRHREIRLAAALDRRARIDRVERRARLDRFGLG